MTKLEPNQDYLLILPLAEDEKTKSGLFISRDGTSPVARGVVKEAGLGYQLSTGFVEVRNNPGDIVTYITGSTVLDLEIKGIKYVIIRDRDIIGKWS